MTYLEYKRECKEEGRNPVPEYIWNLEQFALDPDKSIRELEEELGEK